MDLGKKPEGLGNSDACNQGTGALRDQSGSNLLTGKNVTDYPEKGRCRSEVLT